MPVLTRIKLAIPYVILMIGAFGLYGVANRIAFTPIPDQIGPEVWPKLILMLLAVVCAVAIGRQLLTSPAPARTEPDALVQFDDPEGVLPGHGEDHPRIVFAVVAATVVYLLLLETLGFFLSTLVFTACLMVCGGVRRPLLIAGLALVITLFFTFTFMRIVFVSLPIGTEPFARVSLGVMRLLGVH